MREQPRREKTSTSASEKCQLGWTTVCAVEIDPYCREVLLRRQEDGCLDPFPVWDDVRTFDARAWRGAVDVVTAGFPCQPFSSAGQQLGADDERNLWPETARCIREARPRVALLENVPGLVSSGYLGRVLADLALSGYDARWDWISARETGAPHVRKRVWIRVTDSKCERALNESFDESESEGPALASTNGSDGDVARPPNEAWPPEPAVGRVAHGVARRVEQLRALGNGQVPRVARLAWELLSVEASE